MSKKYKIALFSISVLLIASVFMGTSYSLWQDSNVQEGTNEIKVGCFSVTFMNLASYNGQVAGDINLDNTYPISDESGSNLTPYMFSVKNECSVASDYTINLETLNTSNFNNDFLRLKFNDVNNVTNNNSVLYNTLDEGTIILTDESRVAKKLVTGHLESNDEKTYSLRLWVDKSATTTTPNVMGKIWNGKVVVYSEASSSTPEGDNAVDTIKELADDADPTSTNVIGDTGLAYDGTTDNNLRYVGSNPNNYVLFNNELWRIVGVINNVTTEGGQTQSLLKIRRAEALGNYSWDSSDSTINSERGINQWGPSGTYEGADLMRELNTDYLGNITVGADGKWFNGMSNQKLANMPSNTINDTSQSLIESVVWNLGSPNNDNGNFVALNSDLVNASYSYIHERASTNGKICTSSYTPSNMYCEDNVQRSSTWTGKIGLIYPSDYGYSTSGGSTTNRTTCVNTKVLYGGWNDESLSDCKNNAWLFVESQNQWTLSPVSYAYSSNWIFALTYFGHIANSESYNPYNVFPTLYLKSDVKITGGSGTQEKPYLLG